MKQKSAYKWFFLPVLVSLLSLQKSGAQTGAGTEELTTYLSVSNGSTYEIYSETLYIGPGEWVIDGAVLFYGKNIWIHPDAIIGGAGTLVIRNPADNPYYPDMPAGATLIDGNNGNFIDLKMEHQNPSNIQLNDLTDPGFGISNPSAPLSAALRIGGEFSFEVDNGDVLLNGNNLVFDSDATIGNFSASRMVVTGNSIAAHLVKENYSGSFVFPIGIDEGDYTPATISSSVSQPIYASVQNYDPALPGITDKPKGMYRTWHIYGAGVSAIGLTLQHNSPATNGTSYSDSKAFISQYLGSNSWTDPGTVDFISAGVHSNNSYSVSGSGSENNSFFTKMSTTSPLPVSLLSFRASVESAKTVLLNWQTAGEINSDYFEIQFSTDLTGWIPVGKVKASGQSTVVNTYSFVHNNPVEGINYYRLGIFDQDKSVEYSTIRSISLTKDAVDFAVYPNPARGYFSLKGTKLSEVQSVSICNMTGAIVHRISEIPPSGIIAVADLPAGLYIIRVHTNFNENYTTKLVISR